MSELKIFAGNSHLDFSQAVAAFLNIPLHKPDQEDKYGRQITWFSNGNVQADIKENVRGCDCFVIQTQTVGSEQCVRAKDGRELPGCLLTPNDFIMELYMMISALASAGAARVTAVMPYFPYIRSDKKDKARVAIGARVNADLLTTAGVDAVLMMDPHFAQIHGFFDQKKVKVDTLRAKPVFVRDIRSHYDLSQCIVGAPDVNEAKHAGAVATLLKLPIAIIDKRREGDDEHAKPHAMIGDVRGRNVLMFDDETASGETILESCDFLEKHGAVSLSAFITHGVLSKPSGVKRLCHSNFLRELVVTDTIPLDEGKRNPKIRVVSVAENFAMAIKILHEGGSLDHYKECLYAGLNQ